MNNFSRCLSTELKDNILPFWISRMQDPAGGFYGRMNGKGRIHQDAEKGAILHGRILWVFASAYRMLGNKEYLDAANRARDYIFSNFLDKDNGGIYWSLNADGSVKDSKKQFYALAFVIYGLAELYRANADEKALECAKELFRCIEEHSRDKVLNGYIEACTVDWQPIEDMRLSEKDRNDAKTMNTHLHILEAYTALYRVWKDDTLKESLANLIVLFLEKIDLPNGHLGLFFDEEWNLQSAMKSYGHDIEASWLLYEAAEVLEDEDLIQRTKAESLKMANAASEGFTELGGMIYEVDEQTGHNDFDRHWWVQAECVVGFYNQFQLSGDEQWREKAMMAWAFIHKYLIAPGGEWYWSAIPGAGNDFTPNTSDDRAGFWKCPYHNGRMCMEIMQRIK